MAMKTTRNLPRRCMPPSSAPGMQSGKGGGQLPHTAPAHPSIRKHHFLPPKNVRFGSQDICLAQVQHTIAHVRALQHWAEEMQPPVPSQPHCLVRSVQELWWAMEPLATFTEGDIFVAMVPSP